MEHESPYEVGVKKHQNIHKFKLVGGFNPFEKY